MAAAVTNSTSLFRRLAWSATVPLEIRLADATGPVDRYFLQAPRFTYLSLLLPMIREHLVEVALDDDALARTNEAEWWFELDGTDTAFASDAVRWHWPLDLVDLCAAIMRPAPSPSSSQPSTSQSSPQSLAALSTATPENTPLRLILHLTGAPADKLLVPPGVEATKTHFVAQVKEADFVRWGNTKKVTSLRRADLEAGWDGVAAGDYEMHTRMASRIVPLPLPLPAPQGEDSAYAAKSLPIKLYLPDGAPALQTPVAPLTDGRPTTLVQMLRASLPLLFPESKGGEDDAYRVAQPLAQGILLPPDADVAWLAACMAGADGWLRIGIRVVAE